MARHTTVRCDSRRCRTVRISFSRAKEQGWQLGPIDMCPSCQTGQCNNEVGPHDCSCLLVLEHDGKCACSHTIEPDDPRRFDRHTTYPAIGDEVDQ